MVVKTSGSMGSEDGGDWRTLIVGGSGGEVAVCRVTGYVGNMRRDNAR